MQTCMHGDSLSALRIQGIEDRIDLVGLRRAEDIAGYERFPCDLRQFLLGAAQVPTAVSIVARSRVACMCILAQAAAKNVSPVGATPARPKVRTEEVRSMTSLPTTMLHIKGAKPTQALAVLNESLADNPAARAEWEKKTRIAAVTGSCP